MELNEILSELTILFRKVLSNNSIELKMESTAKDVDDWTSLNHMTIISEIEKKYNVKFAFKEIMKLKNVQDMCVSISSKLRR
jgi:acyl carrier protein